jgi:hypothetical protein
VFHLRFRYSNLLLAMTPTTQSEKPFREVAPGQAFVDHGSLYLKRDDQTAKLIRWASGHLPDGCIVHQFGAETLVKPGRRLLATMPLGR